MLGRTRFGMSPRALRGGALLALAIRHTRGAKITEEKVSSLSLSKGYSGEEEIFKTYKAEWVREK